MVVGEEGLAPAPGPLDRTARAPCRPEQQRILVAAGGPDAVPAADIAGNDPHAVPVDAEGGGDRALEAVDALARRVQRVAPRTRVERAESGFGLHRAAIDPMVVQREPDRAVRRPECRLGRPGVAGLGAQADIVPPPTAWVRRAPWPRARRSPPAGTCTRRRRAPAHRARPRGSRPPQWPRSRRHGAPARPRSAAAGAAAKAALPTAPAGRGRGGRRGCGTGGGARARPPRSPVPSAPRERRDARPPRRYRSARYRHGRGASAGTRHGPGRARRYRR